MNLGRVDGFACEKRMLRHGCCCTHLSTGRRTRLRDDDRLNLSPFFPPMWKTLPSHNPKRFPTAPFEAVLARDGFFLRTRNSELSGGYALARFSDTDRRSGK